MTELKFSFPDLEFQGNNPDTVKLLEDLWAFPLVMALSVNTNKPFLEKSKLAEQPEGIWLSCWRQKQRYINRNLQKKNYFYLLYFPHHIYNIHVKYIHIREIRYKYISVCL